MHSSETGYCAADTAIDPIRWLRSHPHGVSRACFHGLREGRKPVRSAREENPMFKLALQIVGIIVLLLAATVVTLN